jgi:multicomponent Na+:H+ antiporter subunit D
MNIFLVLPVLVPLLTAIISLIFLSRVQVQRVINVIGAAGLLGAALGLLYTVWFDGIQVMYVGNWSAPFGITFVADLLSAIMVVLTGMMSLAVAIYSLASMDVRREWFGYYPLLHILLMGICGSFLTGDIFNLFVWFEVMLIASFVLLSLGGERPQLEGSLKYVTINLISSAFFLTAVGILYGIAGTLNMADLARILPTIPQTGFVTAVAMLLLISFGIKAGAFPLFFWLPASYHTPPVAVSAIFSGLLTKVGVYALIRVFTLLFVQDVGYTHTLILVVAGLTMVTGVLGAVAQNEFRRILSFHIVSQIGYMLMGLGLFTPLGLAGSIFYIIHHIIVKTNLFLVSGVAHRVQGTYDLKKLGGLYQGYPGVAILFLVSAFSLAGLPPFSGFFAKLVLLQAGLEIGQYAIVAVSLVVSVLTLFSMTKIWAEAFWKPAPQVVQVSSSGGYGRDGSNAGNLGNFALLLLPIIALATFTMLFGLAAEPLFILSSRAAEQLLNPADYIETVLGGSS